MTARPATNRQVLGAIGSLILDLKGGTSQGVHLDLQLPDVLAAAFAVDSPALVVEASVAGQDQPPGRFLVVVTADPLPPAGTPMRAQVAARLAQLLDAVTAEGSTAAQLTALRDQINVVLAEMESQPEDGTS